MRRTVPHEDVIRISAGGGRPRRHGLDWGHTLALFMRAMAFVWLVKGLNGAAVVLGMFGQPFQDMPVGLQASTAFAAVGDCLAAVGMWLTASWGGAIWVAVLIGEAGFAFANGASPVLSGLSLVPAVAYVALAVLARRQAYADM